MLRLPSLAKEKEVSNSKKFVKMLQVSFCGLIIKLNVLRDIFDIKA